MEADQRRQLRRSELADPLPTEAERDRRADRAVTGRECEDAAFTVLRALWEELAQVARRLDLLPAGVRTEASYDPVLYERVYRHVLAHRATEVIAIRRLSADVPSSVYAFAFSSFDGVPTPEEAAGFIRAVETRYPDLSELEDEVGRWDLV